MSEPRTFFTVGHSTRSAEELVDLLAAHGVDLLVDVRRHPGSRRHPHFDRDALAATLEAAGIGYRHEEALGGRRSADDAAEDDLYGAWRSDGFRAYARHLNGGAAQRALDRLEEEGTEHRPAVMCAEAVPWKCHRQLVADHLVARGHEVMHLMNAGRADRHELRDIARVAGDGTVTYPARQAGLFEASASDDG